MTERSERNGHCLCGAVRVTARNASNRVDACHCGMCRRWCGGPLMEIDCGIEVSFEGEENITVFDSSPWAERGFCSICGSNLFYRLKDSRQHQVLVGLFDDANNLVFDRQVFIDEKPSFYRFADKTRDLTGAEIVALYGSPD